MTAKSFEAQVRHQPRVAIIDLHGEINAFAEDVLNKAYAEAESRRAEVILLNFSDVDYINSTGIALIVSLLARARKSKRRLLACGLSDHYVEIFQITRLVDFMSVFPDEKSALAEKAGLLSHLHQSKEGLFMPQANVMMNVRRVNPTTSIIDIHGDVSAFAENVLMEAYAEANTPTTRTTTIHFASLKYMNRSGKGMPVTLLI